MYYMVYHINLVTYGFATDYCVISKLEKKTLNILLGNFYYVLCCDQRLLCAMTCYSDLVLLWRLILAYLYSLER